VTRLLSYAGTTVALASTGERAERIEEFVFGAFPPETAAAPVAHYRCGPVAAGRLALHRDGVHLFEDADPGAVAETWMSAVSHDLAFHSRGGLLFHAGALAWRGGAVVLPGSIGAGKTTLTLWLATRGLGYLTDEMVFVADGGVAAAPCTRPLNLKSPSLQALAGTFDPAAHPEGVLASPIGALVSPAVLNPAPPGAPLPWALVLLPRWERGADGALDRLSRAEAGLELMQCLVNARNLPEHGFPAVARLAAAAPVWRLRYSRFDQLAPLEDLLGLR
jgi:hypothetical protein